MGLWLLAAACGPQTSEAADTVVAEQPDASVAAGRCEGGLNLGSQVYATGDGQHAVDGIVATQNGAEGTCSGAGWATAFDRTVGFTAPRAGRWKFTARGNLGSLAVRPTCDDVGPDLRCVRRFAEASDPLETELDMQAQESVYLVMDGCPTGTSCVWSLVAREVPRPANGCRDGNTGCSQAEYCRGEPASASVCVPGQPPVLESAHAYFVPGDTVVRIHATDVDGDATDLQYIARDASGSVVSSASYARPMADILGAETVSAAFSLHGATDAAQVELTLRDATGLFSNTLVVPVEMRPEVVLGAACDGLRVDNVCEAGSACLMAAGAAAFSCTQVFPPTIESVLMHRNPETQTLALELTASDPDNDIRALVVSLLHASGGEAQQVSTQLYQTEPGP